MGENKLNEQNFPFPFTRSFSVFIFLRIRVPTREGHGKGVWLQFVKPSRELVISQSLPIPSSPSPNPEKETRENWGTTKQKKSSRNNILFSISVILWWMSVKSTLAPILKPLPPELGRYIRYYYITSIELTVDTTSQFYAEVVSFFYYRYFCYIHTTLHTYMM